MAHGLMSSAQEGRAGRCSGIQEQSKLHRLKGERKSEEGRQAEEGRWTGWFLLLDPLCVRLFYNGFSNNPGDGKNVCFSTCT